MDMVTVVEIIVNMYGQTTVSSRFAYIFWSMFVLIYLYTSLYERLHSLKKDRELTRWNYPFTLFILGGLSILIYHLTLANGYAKPLPGNPKILGVVGFGIMMVGLAVVCWGRASINGYWGPNIYNYRTENRLVTVGVYKRTRHPVYDGQFLMTLGTVFMVDNLWIAFFPILTLVVNIWRAKREERDLLERFHDDFSNYRNTRPFFLFIA